MSEGRRSPLLTDLVLVLRERGHVLKVFTLSQEPSDIGDHVGERLTVHVRRWRPRRRWIDAFRAERRALVDAMVHHRCDVLHAHWTYEYALAALKADPAHAIVTVRDWGPAVLRRHRHPYRFVRLLMQVVVLVRARHVTANLPYTAAQVARWFRRTVPVIPNGIDVPPSLPARNSGTGLAVGAVNNGFGELKNVSRLLEAFPMVRADRPDAVLRLVGDGYGVGGPAHRWATEHGLAQGV